MKYELPQGESIADWLIDISSGRLEHKNILSSKVADEETDRSEDNKRRLQETPDFRSSAFKLSLQKFASSNVVTNDNHRVGKTGVSTGKVVQ